MTHPTQTNEQRYRCVWRFGKRTEWPRAIFPGKDRTPFDSARSVLAPRAADISPGSGQRDFSRDGEPFNNGETR